jgi:hypothetical protein
MDKTKGSFEGLVHQMRKVVLDLLCALNIRKFKAYFRKKVYVVQLGFLFLLQLLDLQTHIAANPADIRVCTHVIVHFE